jgi:aminopeptidase YwaD
VLARKNPGARQKISVCAHIDTYGGTPGASDNASGTVVLLLLAEMLKGYQGGYGLELLALNGEDNYSAGGQMDYLKRYGPTLGPVAAAVNIDDIGYVKGKTEYSLYNFSEAASRKIRKLFSRYNTLTAGEQWYQGDHMIFAQQGIPAVALTSDHTMELMTTYTHSPRDTIDIVNCQKLVDVAVALCNFVENF